MYSPKKMRINAFKDVVIPPNKDIYLRVGPRVASGLYSGSNPDEIPTLNMNSRKLDSLGSMERVDSASLAYESTAQYKENVELSTAKENSEPSPAE